MKIAVIGDGTAKHAVFDLLRNGMTLGDGMVQVAGFDVTDHATTLELIVLRDGDPIAWERGDVRALLSGPYARPGWVSRCIDPSTGLWETYRLTRRAARRARGRARAAARRLREMGPS
ncbi:hypothetical protein [Sphingomonas sp. Leaf25]|uniref:hypothetical protein n=1 Tax=Sphingomonas sp. Leaf25 TaxID=1735692 RepID=UPI0007126C1C|nr:hypothetical protein [Sphingomonas sp. Leaf25]KQN00558.1 hypothetical protein ASE78_05585 [Sphingomonas sp. Leaf25]